MADYFDSNSVSLFLAWLGSIGVFVASIGMVFIPITFFTDRQRDEPRWMTWFALYFFICLIVISPLRYMMLQMLLSESYFVQSINAAINSMYVAFYLVFVAFLIYAVALILPISVVGLLIEMRTKLSAVLAAILTPFALAVGYALFFLLLPYAGWTIHWLTVRDVIRSANGPATVFYKLVVEPDIPRIGPRLEKQEGDTANERLRAHILATYVSPVYQTKHHFFSSLFHIERANDVLNNQEEGFLVTISKEDSEVIDTAQKAALREALQVDTELLTQYFDGLGTQYREKFIGGLQDLINGWENSDTKIQVRGQMHLNEWGMWFNEHYDAILDAL